MAEGRRTQAAVTLSRAREFAQMCPACLNKRGRDGVDGVHPEIFASMLRNGTCSITRGRVASKRYYGPKWAYFVSARS
jgi:hypothetical protein